MDIPIPGNGVADFPTLHQVNRLLEMYQDGLKSPEIEPDGCMPQLATCEVHSSQPLALYCETCEKLVCRDCALRTCAKMNHNHAFIDDMVNKYESDLSSELELVRKRHKEVKNAIDSITTSRRELQKQKEKELHQVEEKFASLIQILSQEQVYFINSIEESFQEQDKLYEAKEGELSQELQKMEAALHPNSIMCSKTAFLSGFATRKQSISESITSPLSLHPVTLPVKESEICSSSDFRDFCHLKNYHYLKSDPLKCHTNRNQDLSGGSVNEVCNVELYLNSQWLKKGKLNLTAQLHCCFHDFSQTASMKKITNEKYLLSFVPRNRGIHELHIKYGDMHVGGSPLPMFIANPHINQLKKLASKVMDNICGIRINGANLYTCQMHGELKVLNPLTLSLEGTIKVPVGINDIAFDHHHIYATNLTVQKLIKMDMAGTVIESTGTRGSGPGQFNSPKGIRLSRDDELFVCDTNNNRIQVFDKSLNFVRILGRKGSENGCFNSPADLDFDSDGNVYVADEINSRVQVVSPHGQHLRNIGSNSGELALPSSVAIHRGKVFVTDLEGHSVSVFTTAGKFVASFGDGILSHPERIAIDDCGFVYVSDSRAKLIKF